MHPAPQINAKLVLRCLFPISVTMLQGISPLTHCTYSMLFTGVSSCHETATGNIYYSEEICVQKEQKRSACSSTPCMSCQATVNSPKLLVTRTGHQNPKSSFVKMRGLQNLPEVPTPCAKPPSPVKEGFWPQQAAPPATSRLLLSKQTVPACRLGQLVKISPGILLHWGVSSSTMG